MNPRLVTQVYRPVRRHFPRSILRLNSQHHERPNGTALYTTVSAEEVKKFAQMSAEWWAPEGHFQMLHQMNPARIDYMQKFIGDILTKPSPRVNTPDTPSASPTKESENTDTPKSSSINVTQPFRGLRMLDVGCGGGLLCESLARLGGHVTGIDASVENINIAQVHARQDPLLCHDPRQLEYINTTTTEQCESYDVVASMEVIEHVLNPRQFVQDLFALTKPGGLVFLSTIARTPLAYALTILSAEKLLRMVPEGTHDYHKYIRTDELRRLVESNAGGRVLDLRGIWYSPLDARWILVDPSWGALATQANYIMVAQKIRQ
ncbi:Hexaprenyldihydroxybenzoate methyltransferase, mitochondrial [Dispira parvispora]|uniref:Ubiquinone biosynthesis O-methyltransferase, mitochondrial n=1 Tax=Dispira parvispora TaxID=1520584 RepID=A0A9W8ANV8_9FUNG|nr:Hexaprenyldihydroxybenzoate methyltransferase, mitochondrial [Dispira parvispora]